MKVATQKLNVCFAKHVCIYLFHYIGFCSWFDRPTCISSLFLLIFGGYNTDYKDNEISMVLFKRIECLVPQYFVDIIRLADERGFR